MSSKAEALSAIIIRWAETLVGLSRAYEEQRLTGNGTAADDTFVPTDKVLDCLNISAMAELIIKSNATNLDFGALMLLSSLEISQNYRSADVDEFAEYIIPHSETRLLATWATRRVPLFGEIEAFSAQFFISLIEKYQNDSLSPIEIIINSGGGRVDYAQLMYNTMEQAKRRGVLVRTHGLEKIESAALLILSAGSKGYRTAEKRCSFMTHQMAQDFNYQELTREKFDEIKEEHEYYSQFIDNFYREILGDDSFSLENFDNDVYFNSDEALKLHYIDDIREIWSSCIPLLL